MSIGLLRSLQHFQAVFGCGALPALTRVPSSCATDFGVCLNCTLFPKIGAGSRVGTIKGMSSACDVVASRVLGAFCTACLINYSMI